MCWLCTVNFVHWSLATLILVYTDGPCHLNALLLNIGSYEQIFQRVNDSKPVVCTKPIWVANLARILYCMYCGADEICRRGLYYDYWRYNLHITMDVGICWPLCVITNITIMWLLHVVCYNRYNNNVIAACCVFLFISRSLSIRWCCRRFSVRNCECWTWLMIVLLDDYVYWLIDLNA